jgi:hypothetical protein
VISGKPYRISAKIIPQQQPVGQKVACPITAKSLQPQKKAFFSATTIAQSQE